MRDPYAKAVENKRNGGCRSDFETEPAFVNGFAREGRRRLWLIEHVPDGIKASLARFADKGNSDVRLVLENKLLIEAVV